MAFKEERTFKKSFRLSVTIAASDLETAKELYEGLEYFNNPFPITRIVSPKHILNVGFVEDDYPWEEVIVDKYGTNVDIKYIEDENI